jgi:hypothetical protein
MLVLTGGRAPVGIDLESGALVAPVGPQRNDASLKCFDVVIGRLATEVDPVNDDDLLREFPHDPTQLRETVLLDAPLRKVGRLSSRRASRYFRPLLHPPHGPILGFHGPAAPFWSIEGNGPSVSLLRPDSMLGVVVNERGVSAVFRWRGVLQSLPLEAPDVLARLDWMPDGVTSGDALAHVLGYVPRLAVVRISGPRDGYCYKVVSGLVPRS